MKMSLSKIVKSIGIGISVFIAVIVVLTSFEDVGLGEKGFVFKPYSEESIDHDKVYNEGTYFIAPWNEMIVYDVRRKSLDMKMSVLDKKGLEVSVDVSVVYHPVSSKVSEIHTETGRDYKDIIVVPQTRDIFREKVGKYTAQELYSTKRDQLKAETKLALGEKMGNNHLILDDILIRDVDLPQTIKAAILAKEKQEEDNKTAEKREQYEEYQGNALVKKAKARKESEILLAEGKAKSIELINKELSRSPQYNDYIKSKGYAEHGKSFFGNNNVFGVSSTSVIKGLGNIK